MESSKTPEAGDVDAGKAGEQGATPWCDRRREIGELLALVARSLRPIYLPQTNAEFDELLLALDRSPLGDRFDGEGEADRLSVPRPAV